MSSNDTEQDDFDRLLDDFIAKQLSETEDMVEERNEAQANNKPTSIANLPVDEAEEQLYKEEAMLYNAYKNFRQGIIGCATDAGLEIPKFVFKAENLYPRFRPSKIENLNTDVFTGWETMTLAQPVRLSSLPQNPSDEQILNFAEKTTDINLQNALISYVEVLIEVDGCEIAYNLRKAKAKRRKIEKEIYEEHIQRKEKMQKFIEAIRAKNFPIDAERLVNNFFKTVRKDPEGAQKILENNPATFAPIEVEKIPPRFFGFIKPKPEDGIRVNKEIGKFLKNLKV